MEIICHNGSKTPVKSQSEAKARGEAGTKEASKCEAEEAQQSQRNLRRRKLQIGKEKHESAGRSKKIGGMS